MGTVSVNHPKTPVTTGSNGIATAAVPNVCKMPGPPAPFAPTPLPNIGRSNLSPKGFSTSVKIDGKPVAIRGATFGSTGDIASKATGGGIVSANTHGPTAFVAPGSMNVKIEGKSVHLLGEATTNNNGSPPNSSTPAELQAPEVPVPPGGTNPKEIDCEKGPPSGPLSKCEKEEVCAKCADLNWLAKEGKLKKLEGAAYSKNQKLGKAEAWRLAQRAQKNPHLGMNMLSFHATSEECKQEHLKNGFIGTSADHVHDLKLSGHPTADSNLKWMGSRVNSWMGPIMQYYDPEIHTGVSPNCCG